VAAFYPSSMLSLNERSALLGMDEFRQLESKYAST